MTTCVCVLAISSSELHQCICSYLPVLLRVGSVEISLIHSTSVLSGGPGLGENTYSYLSSQEELCRIITP